MIYFYHIRKTAGRSLALAFLAQQKVMDPNKLYQKIMREHAVSCGGKIYSGRKPTEEMFLHGLTGWPTR